MKIILYSGKLGVEEPIFWNNILPYQTIPIFQGKKRKMVIDLLACLELMGPATTTELAKFLITSHYSQGQIEEMRKDVIKQRAHHFWNHLLGFEKKKKGRKTVGKYLGLINEEYVKIVGSKKSVKNKDVQIFFPTLKGHLVSLGYDFTDKELIQFIQNASKNSLYFAYLNDLCEKISLKFVKELFLNPIKKMIEQNRIRFDDDYRLNFDIITNTTALKIRRTIGKSWAEIHSYYNPKQEHLVTADYDLLKEIDLMIKNTWFDLQADPKWVSQLAELYYPTEEQKIFYSQLCDFSDGNLIYKVMREVHSNYYHSYEEKIPVKYKQKFPIPIRRNRHIKEKPLKFPDKWKENVNEYEF